AEAFELCEYGSQPKAAELRRLFPFFGEKTGRVEGVSPLLTECLFEESENNRGLTPPARLAQGDKTSFPKANVAWTIPWDADWVTAVTFVGPGRRLAAGNKLGQIFLWDLPEKTGGAPPVP